MDLRLGCCRGDCKVEVDGVDVSCGYITLGGLHDIETRLSENIDEERSYKPSKISRLFVRPDTVLLEKCEKALKCGCSG